VDPKGSADVALFLGIESCREQIAVRSVIHTNVFICMSVHQSVKTQADALAAAQRLGWPLVVVKQVDTERRWWSR
jgi:hypothetical protein